MREVETFFGDANSPTPEVNARLQVTLGFILGFEYLGEQQRPASQSHQPLTTPTSRTQLWGGTSQGARSERTVTDTVFVAVNPPRLFETMFGSHQGLHPAKEKMTRVEMMQENPIPHDAIARAVWILAVGRSAKVKRGGCRRLLWPPMTPWPAWRWFDVGGT